MKKTVLGAIVLLVSGCYAPLINSGVSTNKPWLEIPAKRMDFDGKQYDSCVQFNLRFWPVQAARRLDLEESCISACCWRSDKSEIVLDFNKNLEQELAEYGYAYKYTPDKIVLRVTHSNLVNITKVTVSDRKAIKRNGLVKLSYTPVEDKARLLQLEKELEPQTGPEPPNEPEPQTYAPQQPATPVGTPAQTDKNRARALLQRQVGNRIENYFYYMNRIYREKGALFILGDRLSRVRVAASDIYRVTCHAYARTGIDEKHLNRSDFPCGTWHVDIRRQTVEPQDDKARQIMQLR